MKKAFNVFIIMMLAFSIFSVFGLVDNVKSATTSNFGFEDDPVNNPYSHTSNGVTMQTTWDDGVFEIESTKRTGSHGFLSGNLNKMNYWNYTFSSGILANWSLYQYRTSGIGSDSFFGFYNRTQHYNGDNNIDDAFIRIWADGQNWKYRDHNNVYQAIGSRTTDQIWDMFSIRIDGNDSVDYHLAGYGSILNVPPQNNSFNSTHMKIDMVRFNIANDLIFYYDDHVFTRGVGYITTPENDTGVTDGIIYFQLYNIENGKKIDFGHDRTDYWYNTYPFIITDFLPFNYGYIGNESVTVGWDYIEGKIKLTNLEFDEGTIYTFYFSGSNSIAKKFKCYIFDTQSYFGITAPEIFYFSPKTYNQAIYSGETYNVYLYPTDYTDGVNYSWYEDNEYIEIALNKRVYDYGETVRCKFRFKAQKMLNNGLPSYNWQLRMCKRTDVVNVVQAGTPFINYLRQDAGDFDFHANWQNVQWQIIEHNDYGYKKYFAKYLCAMMHPYEPWGTNYNLCKIPFWCTGDEFTPEGTIDANPNPATLGQIVTISWTANNSGKIKIASPYGSENNPNYVKSQPFEYSDATRYFNFTPSAMGNYNVELYVDGIETGNASDMPVDTLVLKVNPKTGEEGEHGQFGYGVAYLWIPSYRLVAGLDNVSIYYRTYRNDSQLFIYSPRNETTSYSTTCSNWSDNVHNFHIENWMQIGTWNVTFLAGHINGTNVTLKSSFNIINEEGNWIQFGKNVYYDNEMFNLWLKHDYRISLTFYKDDVAQGQDIIFGKGEHDGEEIIINPEYVRPSPGFWRVEMNRINELNRIYKLAEWTCTVKPAPIDTKASGVFGYNLQTFMLNIDPTIRAIMGISICLSLLLIPLGVTMKMKRPINIPPLTYAIFFMVGVVVSYIIHLWGLEIMFFLCSITALVIVGLYFMGRKSSAPAEE